MKMERMRIVTLVLEGKPVTLSAFQSRWFLNIAMRLSVDQPMLELRPLPHRATNDHGHGRVSLPRSQSFRKQ
jgi:hypothetical protein